MITAKQKTHALISFLLILFLILLGFYMKNKAEKPEKISYDLSALNALDKSKITINLAYDRDNFSKFHTIFKKGEMIEKLEYDEYIRAYYFYINYDDHLFLINTFKNMERVHGYEEDIQNYKIIKYNDDLILQIYNYLGEFVGERFFITKENLIKTERKLYLRKDEKAEDAFKNRFQKTYRK